ncbi:hypothetical protein FRC01_009548 [Tulasnella sp. 417]|nr:hypothetical protein FRC01_009548 [Tulasnella sp. 417]
MDIFISEPVQDSPDNKLSKRPLGMALKVFTLDSWSLMRDWPWARRKKRVPPFDDLYPKLIPLLERRKKRRLRKEAQDRLNLKRKVVWEYFTEWVNEQPKNSLNPPETFCLTPRNLFAVSAVAKLLKSSKEATVSKDVWVKNLTKVATANRVYQEKLVAALRLVLVGKPHPQKIRSIEMGKDPLEDLHVDFDSALELNSTHLLALNAVFFCANCGTTLWFPSLLTHGCCLVEPWTPGSRRDTEWMGKTFHTAKLQPAAQICSFIPRILENLGLSSEVTHDEAMANGKVYLCLRCDDLIARVMSFDELVRTSKHH